MRLPATPQSRRRWPQTAAIEFRAIRGDRCCSRCTRCRDRRRGPGKKYLAFARCSAESMYPPAAVGNEKYGRHVADTDGVRPRAQRLCSGTYLAPKQKVGLLDASPGDQLVGEFRKGGGNRNGNPRVSTFSIHVSCSVTVSRPRSKHRPNQCRLQLRIERQCTGVPHLPQNQTPNSEIKRIPEPVQLM